MVNLRHIERPASNVAVGALVFFHGFYGIPEDFLAFLDKLDPERRFQGYLPQAQHEIGGAGRYSWEHPDSTESVDHELAPVAAWLDALPFDPARLVLGGWSQGAWVTYALGLAAGRPRPRGLLALGGGWPADVGLDLAAPLPAVAIAHGTHDDAVDVENARRARASLEAAGAAVLYRETEVGHTIDPAIVPDLRTFVAALT
jgi:phospholipase/carboxylesterase